ncbi:MAG: SGNH/GDSL hydrolase family protein, partial [Oscillospiraceae bacterium]
MKKLFSVITAVAAAAAVALSVSAEFSSVTILGDSIATGYGLEGYISGDNYSAADSFSSLLAQDAAVENFAVDGRTSGELLSALTGELSDCARESDSVVISIGGNDFLRPMFTAMQTALLSDPELLAQISSGEFDFSDFDPASFAERYSASMIEAARAVDVGETAANLSAIVGEIHGQNPSCEIYLLTVYNPFAGGEGMEEISSIAEDKLSQLNSAIKALEGVTVVDVYSAFKGHEAE